MWQRGGIVFVTFVGRFQGIDGGLCGKGCSTCHGVIGFFDTVPAIVAVHGVEAPDHSRNGGVTDAGTVVGDFLQ